MEKKIFLELILIIKILMATILVIMTRPIMAVLMVME